MKEEYIPSMVITPWNIPHDGLTKAQEYVHRINYDLIALNAKKYGFWNSKKKKKLAIKEYLDKTFDFHIPIKLTKYTTIDHEVRQCEILSRLRAQNRYGNGYVLVSYVDIDNQTYHYSICRYW